jgi:hypothetical protein
MHLVKQLSNQLPAFLNIFTCRELWHAGTGTDGPPKWNQFELIQQEMSQLGFSSQTKSIRQTTTEYVDDLWKSRIAQGANS